MSLASSEPTSHGSAGTKVSAAKGPPPAQAWVLTTTTVVAVLVFYAEEALFQYSTDASSFLSGHGALADLTWACIGAAACGAVWLLGSTRQAPKCKAGVKQGGSRIRLVPGAAELARSLPTRVCAAQDAAYGWRAAATRVATARQVSGQTEDSPDARAGSRARSGDACGYDSSRSPSSPSLATKPEQELQRRKFTASAHAAAKARDMAMCEYWLRRMQACGIQPDVTFCNCVIDACVKDDRAEDAESWLARMQANRVRPNVVTYAALIHGRARRGDAAFAAKWLASSLEQNVEPNIICYNSLISACARHGDVEGAERWFEEADARGLEGSVTTYSTLVDACAKHGNVERAEHWMNVMVGRGITPNVVSYCSMVVACSRSACPQKAKAWHYKMLGQGLTPNLHTFSAVISGCAKAGDIASAEKFLQSMVDYGLVAEAIIYNGVLDACAKAFDCDSAMRVYRQMGAKQVKPNQVTYSSLARPFAHAGDWRTVERLEQEMGAHGIRPNEYFLYARLLSYAAAQPRMPTRAEATFIAARQAGVRVNPRVVTALERAVGRARARQLLRGEADCDAC